jgi:GTPase
VTRSGFIGLAGRPNVGKSTLTNALVGSKVAIVSERPQTTRRAIRGIATAPDAGWQLILIDLPGVQRPRDTLTERMQHRVGRELADSDAVVLVIDGAQGVGPGDRFIARTLASARDAASRPTPIVCAVNKLDVCDRAQAAATLSAAAELAAVDSVYPISARTGEGLEELKLALVELCPEGPLPYPAEMRSDQPSEVHLAELIREQVLRRTRDEIPHAVEVAVHELTTREDGLVEVHAQVWVENESQKAIMIGAGGRMVREVGTAARRELERELGARVFLDLRVRVRAHWRRDESLLDRLEIR